MFGIRSKVFGFGDRGYGFLFLLFLVVSIIFLLFLVIFNYWISSFEFLLWLLFLVDLSNCICLDFLCYFFAFLICWMPLRLLFIVLVVIANVH